MKKIALVAVLATSAAMAAPFNGFSVGGNLGTSFNKLKGDSSYKVTAGGIRFADASTVASSRYTAFVGDIFVGYTKSFSSLLVGADLGLGFESSKKFKSEGAEENATYKPGISFKFSPRIGYKFNDTMAAYFKLGFDYTRTKIELKMDQNPMGYGAVIRAVGGRIPESVKSTKGALSFTPTLGLEKAFGNMSVRGELGYKITQRKDFFKDEKIISGINNVNDGLNVRLKQNAVVMTVGVAYNF